MSVKQSLMIPVGRGASNQWGWLTAAMWIQEGQLLKVCKV